MSESSETPEVEGEVEVEDGLNRPETPDVTVGREKIEAAAKVAESADPMIAALLRERAGYEQYGKTDRVKAVDAELKRRGHVEKDEPKERRSRAAKQATTDSASPKREG